MSRVVPFEPIKSEHEYRTKLIEAQRIAESDPDPHSPAGARLLELAQVIEAWEREHYPITAADKTD